MLMNYLEQFKYTVLEMENNEEEVDEEEEETDNEEEEGEEGEEEEIDLFKRDRKKHLGDTSIYDPVTLVEKNVLQPGKPDLVLSYDSKTYRFANEENRSTFLQAPLKYLSINKPPTVRSVNFKAHVIDGWMFLSLLAPGLTSGFYWTRRCGEKFAWTGIGDKTEYFSYQISRSFARINCRKDKNANWTGIQ